MTMKDFHSSPDTIFFPPPKKNPNFSHIYNSTKYQIILKQNQSFKIPKDSFTTDGSFGCAKYLGLMYPHMYHVSQDFIVVIQSIE